MKRVLGGIIIVMIQFYKNIIAPYMMPVCRYTPTCSEYGIQAITKYGPIKGGWMTLKRFVSCNPWGGHGHDPVQ